MPLKRKRVKSEAPAPVEANKPDPSEKDLMFTQAMTYLSFKKQATEADKGKKKLRDTLAVFCRKYGSRDPEGTIRFLFTEGSDPVELSLSSRSKTALNQEAAIKYLRSIGETDLIHTAEYVDEDELVAFAEQASPTVRKRIEACVLSHTTEVLNVGSPKPPKEEEDA